MYAMVHIIGLVVLKLTFNRCSGKSTTQTSSLSTWSVLCDCLSWHSYEHADGNDQIVRCNLLLICL